MYDTIIIGGGPAGLTAAIYAGRMKRKTRLATGPSVGGQIFLTYQVDNYPGFPEGITGPDLVDRLVKQVERFGAVIDKRMVDSVDFSSHPYKVRIKNDIFETIKRNQAVGKRLEAFLDFEEIPNGGAAKTLLGKHAP